MNVHIIIETAICIAMSYSLIPLVFLHKLFIKLY